MIKRCSIILIVIVIAASCAKFHVKREINNSTALSKLKNTGIIVRIPYNSQITIPLINKSISQWLEPYKKPGNLTIIENVSKNLYTLKAEYDRFAQFTPDHDFQYYQSVGIVKQYLNKNREELDKIKKDNNLDSLIFYEIDGFISAEMQVYNFSSMILIIDNAYQIAYMDHQFDTYETAEIDKQVLRENLLDYISNRFLDLLMKLKYIREP